MIPEKLKNAAMDVLTLAISGLVVAFGETVTGDIATDIQLTLTGAAFVFLKSLNAKDPAYGFTKPVE